jgi:hypothetical protein
VSLMVIPKASKLKYFFFDTRDRRTVERGIGGYYKADTTGWSQSVDPNTRVTAKTYSFTASAKTNKIRIRVYGYCGSTSFYAYININGTDVAEFYIPSSADEQFIGEYIGDLTPNTDYTISIIVYHTYTSAVTINITRVYVIAGFGLTSTSSVDILTITLDPDNDIYSLRVNGNFVYGIGVKWWCKGNRKTTAGASITSTLANERYGTSNLGAGDDGDSEVFLRVGTGDYATSFTISGYVGAEGDIIIITSIYCQITLHYNIRDTYNLGYHYILVRERGLLVATARIASPTGVSTSFVIRAITVSGLVDIWVSGVGTTVMSTSPVIPAWDMPEYAVDTKYFHDDIILF